jgi:hypothetical protein
VFLSFSEARSEYIQQKSKRYVGKFLAGRPYGNMGFVGKGNFRGVFGGFWSIKEYILGYRKGAFWGV